MDTLLYNYDVIVESFHEMQSDQIGRDRMGYFELAMEAISNPQSQSVMLNKLYNETKKIDELDFGKIPDSKGDLTKYSYYPAMADSIQVLNDLLKDSNNVNLVTMNKLHQILLNGRDDFVFGFKTDNFIITSMYKVMVSNLYELINVCIVDATEYIRSALTMKLDKSTSKKIRYVTNNANSFIKMYESGQWNTLMKAFRNKASQKAYESISSALEAEGDVLRGNITLDLTSATNSAKKIPGLVKNIGTTVLTNIEKLPMAAKIIGAVIACLLIIRTAIKYFMSGMGRLSYNIRNQATLLKAAMNSDGADSSSVKFRQKVLNSLEKTADVIDYKILKMEKDANTELKKSNREEFSMSELRTMTDDSGFSLA